MQQATQDVTPAIALARQVLSVYERAYPDDKRLERALDLRSPPEAVEAIMFHACDVAEQAEGEQARRHALHRAAYAAESIFLALHPQPDIPDLQEAVQCALMQ